jgi:hypothetical protein
MFYGDDDGGGGGGLSGEGFVAARDSGDLCIRSWKSLPRRS